MNKTSLRKLALISLIIGVIVLAISYFFFHFVTDEGITFVFHEEAVKPFVTNLIANLGVMFVFSSASCFISSFLFFKDDKKEN